MSDILANWKAGLGMPDTLVIDGHIHVGEWQHACTFASVEEAVRESTAFMDANGVDAMCAMAGGLLKAADYRLGNDFLLAVWRRLPERCIPFMALNPNDTPHALASELDRLYGAGVRCIKLINDYQERYPGDGPNLMLVYEFAAAHRMLVFNHSWASDVIVKISRQFPDVDFVFGHYNGGRMDEVLIERQNVHTNIWNLGGLGWLDRGIKRVGAHKFMLGSDGFLNALSAGIGPVVFADISDEEKRLILGTNVARLLDKVGALPQAIKVRGLHA